MRSVASSRAAPWSPGYPCRRCAFDIEANRIQCEAARRTLTDALNGYHVEGLSTNIDFANAILNHPAFIDGALSTGLVSQIMEGPATAPPLVRLHHMAIAATLVFHNRHGLVVESLRPMSPTVGGVHTAGPLQAYVVKAEGDVLQVRLRREPEAGRWTVWIDERCYDVVTPAFEFHRRRLKLSIDGEPQPIDIRHRAIVTAAIALDVAPAAGHPAR